MKFNQNAEEFVKKIKNLTRLAQRRSGVKYSEIPGFIKKSKLYN